MAKRSAMSVLLTNSALLLMSRVLLKGISFVVVVMTIRYLGVARFGLVSYALAVSGVFSIVLDLGVTQFTIREIAKEAAVQSEILSAALWMKIAAASLAAVASLTGALVWGSTGNGGAVVWILVAATAVRSIGQVPYSAFAGKQRMGFIAAADVVQILALIVGVTLTIAMNGGVLGIAFSYSGSFAATMLFSFLMVPRVMPISRAAPTVSLVLHILKRSYPLALMAMSVEIYSKIDTIMLKLLVDDVAVGYYASAYRFVATSLVFSGAYISALFPFLSNWLIRSVRRFRKYATASFRGLLYTGLGLSLFLSTIAPEILGFLYGEEFVIAAQTLRVLSWATTAMFLGGLTSTLMIVLGSQLLNFVFIACTILVNLLLDLVLIPRMHHTGAALATLLAEGFYLVLSLGYLLRRKVLVLNPKRIIPVPVFCVFAAFLFLRVLGGLGVPTVLAALASVIFHFAVCVAFGFERAEKSFAWHSIRRWLSRIRPSQSHSFSDSQ